MRVPRKKELGFQRFGFSILRTRPRPAFNNFQWHMGAYGASAGRHGGGWQETPSSKCTKWEKK
jgi:hypothetical protein